ncbi:MAG: GAF domain-containing protein, partial [bacterium]
MGLTGKIGNLKRIHPMGVRTKLLLSFVLLIMVTNCVFFFITYTHTRRLAQEHMLNKVEQLAVIFSDQINRDIKSATVFVEGFAKTPEIRAMNPGFLPQYFGESHPNESKLDALFIFDSNGAVQYKVFYCKTIETELRNPDVKKGVSTAIKNNKTLVLPVPRSLKLPGTIYIIAPINGMGGEAAGAVVGIMSIDSKSMEHIIYSHQSAGKKMQLYFVNREGDILTRPNAISENRCFFGAKKLFEPLAGAWARNKNKIIGEAGEFYFENKGEKYMATAAAAETDLGWYILLVQPISEAYVAIKAVSLRILWLGALAVFVAIYLALYRARRITKPISEIIQAVEELSRGDYSKRVHVYRRDEFGSLAFSFNRMSDVLQEKIAALQESQSQLEEAFNQLQNDTLKREESNRELSRKVRELTSLSEVTHAITNSLDLNILLETIVDTINRIMGFETCSVKLFDKLTNTLKIKIARGLGDEYLHKDDTVFGEGISGLAVKMLKSIVIDNVETDHRVPQDHLLRKLGIKSIISIPLITKQSVMGVLNLYAKEKHTFTEDEKQLLGIFANQAAGAIENARLFDSLRDSYLNTIQALSMTIDAKDKYTHGHSKRVSDISMLIGREMNLSRENLELLKYSSD